MTATVSGIRGTFTFARGVHPPERKELAKTAAIEALPAPAKVEIPVLQHIGAPCAPTVKSKAKVEVGDMVAEAQGFVSSPVHASVAGVVARASVTTLPNGRHVPVIPIKADAEQPLSGRALVEDVFGGDWPTDGLDKREPQQIADAARAAGLVGMGGAAFPTHVKFARNEKKPIDTLLVNGCECEPYLTADYRLMIEFPAPIVAGAMLGAVATGAKRVAICVEDNKPDAVEALRAATAGTPVDALVMKTKYPQGGEKQLIVAALGREVPTGGLPLDVGVVVMNVGTSAALARAVMRGKPMTHRIVSVTGAGVANPKNILAPIGASYRNLIDFCGGLKEDAARVVSGGPMMGFTLGSLDTPVTKGTSGVTVMTRREIKKADETTCVRCGRCVDACPMRLVPTKIALASRGGDLDLAQHYSISACMECGSCAFACPASIPLVQLIRLGKVSIQKAAAAKKDK